MTKRYLFTSESVTEATGQVRPDLRQAPHDGIAAADPIARGLQTSVTTGMVLVMGESPRTRRHPRIVRGA
jgi:S-adenosylmethionine synthetase